MQMHRSTPLFVAISLAVPPVLRAGQVASDQATVTAPLTSTNTSLHAERLSGVAPVVDGSLTDEVWTSVHHGVWFIERVPTPGDRASHRTGVQVVYDDQALYVAMRLFDPSADSIVGTLTRRDVSGDNSDWAHVYIDSYDDQRTAFRFSVNPRGVQVDVLHYGDTQQDISWDAVWTVGTSIDSLGWTAEFRIPLSQLRFASTNDRPEADWGINFSREIARYGEHAYWAPIDAEAAGFVSQFGRLSGLVGLRSPQRLEVQPFAVSQLRRPPVQDGNPFGRANQVGATFGADVKYGISSDFTLTLAINPDFGQVEADPSVVNLTAFESFFPEKRAFFTEGSELFQVTFPRWQPVFHTRRIGRAPQGSVPREVQFQERPDRSTILTAAKINGKTSNGLSVALISALTEEESARYLDAGGDTLSIPIEPATAYTAARVVKDFRAGQTAIGGLFTATNRANSSPNLDALHSAAYVGGIDGRHRFGNGRYEVSGSAVASHVRGSPIALTRTQRSSVHNFQRPQATHLRFDPDRTTLSGVQAGLRFAKIGGGHWRFEANSVFTSPGFHINDLGFQNETDRVTAFARVGYDQFNPSGPFRRWQINGIQASGWTTAGERRYTWVQLFGEGQLKNYWSFNVGLDRTVSGLSTGRLRGGPALHIPGYVAAWLNVASDPRRSIAARLNAWGRLIDESEGHELNIQPTFTLRPSSRVEASLGFKLGFARDISQYVGTQLVADSPEYILGNLHQTTASVMARLNYTFTPTLSLQLYAQPFVSSGRYAGLKIVNHPSSAIRSDRYSSIDNLQSDGDANRYSGTIGGESVALDNPDFNFQQFRSNVVLRWEYRPGSTLFLVWGQDRTASGRDGRFDVRRDLRNLVDARGTNTFLLKINYWIGR